MSGAGNPEGRIRERAYALWEQDGRPDGRSHEHWEQASQEVESEEVTAEAKPGTPQTAQDSTRGA